MDNVKFLLNLFEFVYRPGGKIFRPGLAGQVIVFTGFRDKDLVADIEKNAGKFASGLTRKTTLLVYDPNGKAGSKLDKAQAMGIKTMTREKFTRKVGRM